MLYPFELTLLSTPHPFVGEVLLSVILLFCFLKPYFHLSISVLPLTVHLFCSSPLSSLLAKRTTHNCCSLALLLSSSLFLLYFEQAVFLPTGGEHSLLWVVFKPASPPFYSIFYSSSTARAASLSSSEAALFIFLSFSTSSPCIRAFKTPVKVRGEDLGHLSSISLNVTRP